MVEETEYDDVVQCDHSYDKRCHTTYVTNYESQQEEECEENFRKSCFIEYEKIAFNETVSSAHIWQEGNMVDFSGENLPRASCKRLRPTWR